MISNGSFPKAEQSGPNVPQRKQIAGGSTPTSGNFGVAPMSSHRGTPGEVHPSHPQPLPESQRAHNGRRVDHGPYRK